MRARARASGVFLTNQYHRLSRTQSPRRPQRADYCWFLCALCGLCVLVRSQGSSKSLGYRRLERISKMPQEDDGGGQLDHPEKVVGVTFPAGDDAPEVMKPREEPIDFPAAPEPSKRPAIFGPGVAIGVVGGDQLDAIGCREMVIEPVAVVALVADQSCRELAEESRGERRVDEGDFMRRSAGHVDGERKTMAVANRHDFAALTAASRADGGAPFLAELKLASMKASLRSSFPRSRRSSASRCKTRSNRPLRCQA